MPAPKDSLSCANVLVLSIHFGFNVQHKADAVGSSLASLPTADNTPLTPWMKNGVRQLGFPGNSEKEPPRVEKIPLFSPGQLADAWNSTAGPSWCQTQAFRAVVSDQLITLAGSELPRELSRRFRRPLSSTTIAQCESATELTDEYDGRRAVPKNFFMLLESYQNHPEAKSLGPNGKACAYETRGLLQRAHIVANCPPIYIGKESDTHWEEGEDLSLLELKTIEYKRKGYAIATDEQLALIAKVPKRQLMRGGINQHTFEKIRRREPVRVSKLVRCLKLMEDLAMANLLKHSV